MMDLKNYTVKEFAEAINETTETIKDLMDKSKSLSYTNKPYDNTLALVEKSSIKDSNKEITAKYIYTNLFNRPEHRFYR